MSTLGIKIDQFDVPVCNAFQAKVLNDQLCYEVDLNRYSNKSKTRTQLEFGLNLLVDYNEDRQVISEHRENPKNKKNLSMVKNILKLEDYNHAIVYFDSIGKILQQLSQKNN